MSGSLSDRLNWFLIDIQSGEEKRIGVSITDREWGVEIDNRKNLYYVSVIGRKADGSKETADIAGGERVRVYVNGKELFLYNDNSDDITIQYAYP